MTLRNRHLGRTNSIEEEIDSRGQTKKKRDSIEKLIKEAKELKLNNFILQDLD